MKRYRDRQTALADATLIRLAERQRLTEIVTIDSGFENYRAASGRRFLNHFL